MQDLADKLAIYFREADRALDDGDMDRAEMQITLGLRLYEKHRPQKNAKLQKKRK